MPRPTRSQTGATDGSKSESASGVGSSENAESNERFAVVAHENGVSFADLRVLIAPEHLEQLSLVSLPHPRTGLMVRWAVGADASYELLRRSDPYRSWLWGDRVLSPAAGAAVFFAPVHPALLALPAVVKHSAHFKPAADVLDGPYSALTRCTKLLDVMRTHLCTVKIVGGDEVFRYDAEGTLKWLRHRLDLFLDGLKRRPNVMPNSTASEEWTKRFAWSLLSEYLCDELADALRLAAGVADERKVVRAAGDGGGDERAGKRKLDEPTDDYHAKRSPTKKDVQSQSAKAVKLKKASVGTKNIAVFFGKK